MAAAAAALGAGNETAAPEGVRATLADERPVQAAPVKPGFPIDYLGVVWEFGLPAVGSSLPGEPGVAVRFRVDGVWGLWQQLVADDLQEPGQWGSGLMPAGDAEAYQVRGVPVGVRAPRVVVLNTTDGPPLASVHRPPATSAPAVCLSRAEWGADESLRFVDGEESWPVEFRTAQVMTVHHTVTANADPDPAATVRAIYVYHTVTRDWGDIGYHYLIDEAGRVYEGRWSGEPSRPCGEGGDGSDFGHDPTGLVVTAGHTYCYNRGNLGMALLGDFTATLPQPAAKAALEALLAEDAGRHGLDPLGTIYYEAPNDIPACAGVVDAVIEVIPGHTDWPDPAGNTSCPGAMFHSQLHAVRANVAGVLPASFGKASPEDGATGQPPDATLSWTMALGADAYEYCYDKSNDGACSPWVGVGPATGVEIDGLEYGTIYYWQVRAVNMTGTVSADGGACWQFTTAGPPPGAFGKVSPADGAGSRPRDTTLSWEAAAGADAYEYCYDKSNDGACSPWVGVGPATGVEIGGLEYGTTYYWQVRALGGSGSTYADGGAWWGFTTEEPTLVEEVFPSSAQHDGWIRERDEDAARGYAWDNAGTGRLGDDAFDRQYRSILHFDTGTLPDNAVVMEATLRIRREGFVGANPFRTHGLLVVDLQAGAYHDDALLERFDFHAVGSRGNVGRFIKTPADRWYRAPLRSPALGLINLTGTTQLRLRFKLDDDDDMAADYLSFFTGDAAPANRPQLIITYYLP